MKGAKSRQKKGGASLVTFYPYLEKAHECSLKVALYNVIHKLIHLNWGKLLSGAGFGQIFHFWAPIGPDECG